MITKKITNEELSANTISSLPTRPTAPKAFGGRGYTAGEMKAAFDKLPLLISQRFNQLIDEIEAQPELSIAGSLLTGINDGHTLKALFSDIKDGSFCAYLNIFGEPMNSYISAL
jgi:hypothetical protein